jgi:branched-chain amino acid transport system substrate-binding protein
MTRKLRIGTGALAIISALLFTSCESKQQPKAQARIAINLPLTGPVAAYTGHIPNGFRMGLEEAEKKFNVDPSRISTDFQDNAGTATTAVSVFQKQRLDNPNVYVSGTSEAAIAIANQVDALKIPNFLIAFDPYLAHEGPNRLRVLPNSKIEGPLFVQYAKQIQAKKVFILNLNSAYANSEVDNIIGPGLKEAGIDYRREQYEFSLRDFKNLALKAKAYSPDVIFVIGYSFHLKPLLRDLRGNGLVRQGSVMASMDFIDMLYDRTPKEELASIAFACPIFEVKDAIADAPAWRQRYEARFGTPASYVEAYAYDTASLIVKALGQNGGVTTQNIRAALPLDGITGTVNLDKDGDIIATITIGMLDAQGSVNDIAGKKP